MYILDSSAGGYCEEKGDNIDKKQGGIIDGIGFAAFRVEDFGVHCLLRPGVAGAGLSH